jgi:hypothetical protein
VGQLVCLWLVRPAARHVGVVRGAAIGAVRGAGYARHLFQESVRRARPRPGDPRSPGDAGPGPGQTRIIQSDKLITYDSNRFHCEPVTAQPAHQPYHARQKHQAYQARHADAASRGGLASPPPRGRRWGWLDRLAGTDPGLMRLQLAGEVSISIGIILAVEWTFVRATGALRRPVPAGTPVALAARLAVANHDLMVIAMLLGAIIAMLGGFAASMYLNARSQRRISAVRARRPALRAQPDPRRQPRERRPQLRGRR